MTTINKIIGRLRTDVTKAKNAVYSTSIGGRKAMHITCVNMTLLLNLLEALHDGDKGHIDKATRELLERFK